MTEKPDCISHLFEKDNSRVCLLKYVINYILIVPRERYLGGDLFSTKFPGTWESTCSQGTQSRITFFGPVIKNIYLWWNSEVLKTPVCQIQMKLCSLYCVCQGRKIGKCICMCVCVYFKLAFNYALFFFFKAVRALKADSITIKIKP